MSDEKEVEELAEVLSNDFCAVFDDGQGQDCSLDCDKCRAERVLRAGYRKADEVRKEIVSCILADIRGAITTAIFSFKPELKMDLTTILLQLERDYGEGVDE